MAPIHHATSIHWIIKFGSNAGVLTKAATEAKTSSLVLQDAQLSQRDRAAGCVIVFAESRTLERGDNDLRIL